MEYPEHKSLLRKNLPLLIVLPILVGVAALLFSYYAPTYYKSSISFAVNRINKQETVDYQYDGYYAIQASDLFSQTVVSWFFTPSVLLEIYEQAEVEPNIDSLERFTNRFKAKKYSSQNIVVSFKERDQDTAEKISQSIIQTVQDRGAKLNQTSDQKALFEVVGSTPVIDDQKPNVILNTVIGIIVGFFAGLGLVYLIRYFKNP